MKRYLFNNISFPVNFTIEVIVYPKDTTTTMPVAATEYKGYQIPDGPFMPADKKIKPSKQQIVDYRTFIKDIESMLSDHHELKLIYKNKSANYSNYYSFLALNDKGEPVFRFRLRLRISTHDPHRTKEQQKEEAKEEKAVAKYLNGKKPQKMTKIIIVNDDSEYTDYLDAFVDICNIVDHAVEVMRR